MFRAFERSAWQEGHRSTGFVSGRLQNGHINILKSPNVFGKIVSTAPVTLKRFRGIRFVVCESL